MIDTHAHIHDAQFDSDRDAVIRRAHEMGVVKILTIGTNVEESRKAKAMAGHYGEVFASVAVHPEEYSKLPSVELCHAWMDGIDALARDAKVVGIGECGLDYHEFGGIVITEGQRYAQKAGFLEHLELAVRMQKPIIIHARQSYDDVYDMVREYVEKLSGIVMHCYQGDTEITRKFLDLGETVAFSFAGNITYPVKKSFQGTKDDICETIGIIPIDRILTETDCPYLAPQEFRGTRNEPSFVFSVARIAEVKQISLEAVERATEENARRYFPMMFV